MATLRTAVEPEERDLPPAASPEQVAEVFRRARAVQAQWAALPLRERIRRVKRLQAVIFDHRDEIVRTIVAETATAQAEAEFQVVFSLAVVAYWCRKAPGQIGPRRVRPPLYVGLHRAQVNYRPLGVVANIGTWNFPWHWPCVDAVPAMIAGNAVVYKPSEFTPRCALLFARLCREAGLPPDLYQVVCGGAEVGAALVEQADMVTFTGSESVGRRIAEAAGRRMIPVLLEMGGKDPLIVLKDANLEQAARAAVWGGLLFSGQACVSVERIYVEEPVYEPFLERLVHHFRQVRLGTGQGCEMGPMVTDAQLAKVERLVADAVARGARVLCGGHRVQEKGERFYAPTVLADVDDGMAIMQEETFGPVVTVQKVANPAEAVRAANAGPFGLASSIFAGNRRQAWQLAQQLEAGSTMINDVLLHFHVLDLPFGGVKGSSFGHRGGADSIKQFVRPHSIMEDPLGMSGLVYRFPFTRKIHRLVEWVIRLWFGRGLRRFFG